MADENIKFKFDLDAREAIVKITEFREALGAIGESKSVDGLVAGFTKMVPHLAILTTSILAVKTALDMTLEGEAIARVNKQFEILAQNAGLSADALKEGIEKSLGGMADLDDSLKASSEAIVKLGRNAERIPEIFELARKTSLVFGGTIEENFNSITQAVATGNARLLKQLGIIVDADKAYQNFAKSIGTTASALSQTEKQQAMLNAVLTNGKEKLSGIADESNSATVIIQKLQVSFKEFYDSLSIFVSQTGIVRAALNRLSEGFSLFGTLVKENLIDGPEKASKRMSDLTLELAELKLTLAERQAGESGWLDKMFGAPTQIFENRIAAIRKEMAALQGQIKEPVKSEKEEPTKAPKIDEEALNLRRAQQSKFQNELLQMAASRIRSQQEIETEAVNYNQLLNEQRLVIEQQFNSKIQELKIKGEMGKEITAAQASSMIIQIEAEKHAKLIQFDKDRDESFRKLYDNQIKYAQTVSDGIAANAKKDAEMAKEQLKNGTFVYGSLKSASIGFFKSLGDGSANAAEAMKKAMFGFLGEYAIKKGEVLLAEGLGAMFGGQPGGAGMVAQGGALITLGAAIQALGGGGGGSTGVSGGGSGGAGEATISPGGATRPMAEESPKKTVTVNFLGDYLETEQTQKRLVDLIRRETDATEYKYQQIPVR